MCNTLCDYSNLNCTYNNVTDMSTFIRDENTKWSNDLLEQINIDEDVNSKVIPTP